MSRYSLYFNPKTKYVTSVPPFEECLLALKPRFSLVAAHISIGRADRVRRVRLISSIFCCQEMEQSTSVHGHICVSGEDPKTKKQAVICENLLMIKRFYNCYEGEW